MQGLENSLGHFWKIGDLSFSWDGFSTFIGVHPEGLGVRPQYQVSATELLAIHRKEDIAEHFRTVCSRAFQTLHKVPTSIDALIYALDARLVVEKEE